MLRSLGRVSVTLLAMILVFYGLRGFVADTWPGAESGILEVLVYCVSVIYGFAFDDWLDKKVFRKRTADGDPSS